MRSAAARGHKRQRAASDGDEHYEGQTEQEQGHTQQQDRGTDYEGHRCPQQQYDCREPKQGEEEQQQREVRNHHHYTDEESDGEEEDKEEERAQLQARVAELEERVGTLGGELRQANQQKEELEGLYCDLLCPQLDARGRPPAALATDAALALSRCVCGCALLGMMAWSLVCGWGARAGVELAARAGAGA